MEVVKPVESMKLVNYVKLVKFVKLVEFEKLMEFGEVCEVGGICVVGGIGEAGGICGVNKVLTNKFEGSNFPQAMGGLKSGKSNSTMEDMLTRKVTIVITFKFRETLE
ncbi:hypothetical protein V6N11_046016 [Hibiscus sabdariffa]|uniref:Uncharacterized protein n=1 Tax=Hibiscus sabdariffa TaxID=183260 RepID=A0ABR2Q2N3_9ROSI